MNSKSVNFIKSYMQKLEKILYVVNNKPHIQIESYTLKKFHFKIFHYRQIYYLFAVIKIVIYYIIFVAINIHTYINNYL